MGQLELNIELCLKDFKLIWLPKKELYFLPYFDGLIFVFELLNYISFLTILGSIDLNLMNTYYIFLNF